MKLKRHLVYLPLILGFVVHGEENKNPLPVQDPVGRPLCTTLTQSQQVRFEQCMNGEVMTGIRSLDPLTVYCTRLLANCPIRNESKAEKDLTGN